MARLKDLPTAASRGIPMGDSTEFPTAFPTVEPKEVCWAWKMEPCLAGRTDLTMASSRELYSEWHSATQKVLPKDSLMESSTELDLGHWMVPPMGQRSVYSMAVLMESSWDSWTVLWKEPYWAIRSDHEMDQETVPPTGLWTEYGSVQRMEAYSELETAHSMEHSRALSPRASDV